MVIQLDSLCCLAKWQRLFSFRRFPAERTLMNTVTLRVGGEVATPRQFSFDDLAALPHQIPDISVLAPGRQGRAVRLRALLGETGLGERATYLTLYADDGAYSASVPL